MRLPAADLDDAAQRLRASCGGELEGATVVITGGSGFIGRWMVETFATLRSGHIFVMTRDVAAVRDRAPHLAADPSISLVAREALPDCCDFVVHAATDSAENLVTREPRRFVDAIEQTNDALEYASRANARRVLYISSGAVYGKQPPDVALLTEDFGGSPDPGDFRAAYAESKRAGEMLCALHKRAGQQVTLARLFSVIGPLIPLGPKFAAGQFLDDALHGRPIEIRGDGTPLRSYLYAADVAVWLWTILIRGENGRAYNAGSETAVSIRELADAAANLITPPVPVVVHAAADPSRAADRYLPSTERARRELGVSETVGWRDALKKTFEWYRSLDDPRF